jgi:peptide/nickel transport system permease protein
VLALSGKLVTFEPNRPVVEKGVLYIGDDGLIAAVRQRKASDYVATSAALVGLSVPHFWLGLMMISLFAVNLHWLPASGYVPFTEDPIANLQHMIMPAIVLGTGLSAVLMRQMRSSMLNSLGADYVRTARAKGLTERSVVMKHALRNSLITVTTIIGLQLGALISGVVVTESIFVIPGFGRLTLDAINQRDYTLLQGVVLVSAAGYVFVNLTVDVLYSVLNPRIRVAGTRT